MKNKKIEQIACYVRVSTQEQKLHGLSLDAQKMKLQEYADKHKMKIVGWYVDEGVSGRKLIKNRPELQRMLIDAERGMFDRIIFIKLDRFFRSVAEYHECMKRIAPVVWSATEEDYDLTTANGRLLVNMKLTIAELEADQTGERIKIVNDYKVSVGQAIGGGKTFGFMIEKDLETKKKVVVHDPEQEHIMYAIIDHILLYQSKKKTIAFLFEEYGIHMEYTTLTKLLKNPWLYGCYRGNPNYCKPYCNKEVFDRLQDIATRNIKRNTADNRTYLFSGLVLCPECGNLLKGYTYSKKYGDTRFVYKRYRCARHYMGTHCAYNMTLSENVLERKMLDCVEEFLRKAKIEQDKIAEKQKKKPKVNIDAINAEIDRLNYSWQTGKIRSVELYEEQYAKLTEKLESAQEGKAEVESIDYSHIDGILQNGWKEMYKKLDDERKQAFWRSFIKSVEIDWTTEIKEIARLNFF